MALPAFLAKIVSWLRAGYPDGVPEHDYVPLFALLGSQLTDDEVKLIADGLRLLLRSGFGGGDQEGDQRYQRRRSQRLRHRPGPLAPRSGRLAAGDAGQGLTANHRELDQFTAPAGSRETSCSSRVAASHGQQQPGCVR